MEPTHRKPLSSLSADSHCEEEKFEPDDEPDPEPPSPYAEKAIRHLQSMYQKLYPCKDPKDFADRWQGFAEITAAIDKATEAQQSVIRVQYPVTQQKPASRVPTALVPPFIPKKLSGLFKYDQDFAQSLLPRTEIFKDMHAAATGGSSMTPQHKP